MEISWNFVSPEKWEPCKITLKSYVKNNLKIPGEKSWKYHGILSVQQSGKPEFTSMPLTFITKQWRIQDLL